MTRIVSGYILLSLLLGACGDNSGTPIAIGETTQPQLHSGLLPEYMNTAVKPGDDFNAYVNGGWIDTATIPADKPGYGIGMMLNDQSQEQVKAIIEQSAEGDFAKGSDEQKVGDLYRSYMDMEKRNALGVSPLESEFEKIDALRDYDELAVYFAEANKLGYSMPFALLQYVDFKDPTTYMMYIYQGGLGLPDREYYFNADARSDEIRQKYVAHVATMLEMAGIVDDGDASAGTIMQLEMRMAAEHMKKEQTRDMVALYNKIPTPELPALMPNFNWDAYLAEAGIPDIDGIVVTQLDYIRALDGIITGTGLDTWKTWLKWAALNASAGLLTEELDRQNFEFYGRTLQGTEEPLPLWRRGVSAVNANLGEVVGKVYVKEHFPPQAKERMMDLVNNLLKAYEISIRELDWMSDDTKAQALDKLSKFTPKIGYPDIWKDYSALDIEKDDLVGNMQRSALVVYQQQLEKQKGPVQKHEWQMTPQTVNAYYNPPLNEIVFPAAILQPPFFDLHAEDAVNYGAIGAVIGHEIGHGFDDSGSTFDGDGVLRDWWTEGDKEEFKKRTARLVEQYSAFKPYDDINVNGEFTLGENIGDLGGLSIALHAYRLSLGGKEAPVMDGFTGEQRVFLGYAQAWRHKYREESLRTQIATDPHSPRMYRVNGVVRNVPEFYSAFDVQEDEALYLAPSERVKIW
ncbi:MAG TPA: M13 family metallopeptidase [Woeseiaceae bacterium]|nr:M13 family metallopeptidase [Woeseiaceae bacterium]